MAPGAMQDFQNGDEVLALVLSNIWYYQ